MEQLKAHGRAEAREVRMQLRPGELRDVQISSEIITLSDQPCILTVAQDITERRLALEALRESEERFRTVVERSPEGIIIVQDWRFVFVNAAAVQLFGATSREILEGRSFFDFVPEQWMDHARQSIRRILEESFEEPPMERALLRTDGTTLPVELCQTPFSFEGRPAALVFMHDISERQQALRHLRDEARRTEVLLELYSRAPQLQDKELFDFALEKAVELTESEIGFFHRISDDQQTIILTTWNAKALENCTAQFETHYPVSEAGNWTDCIRTRAPIVYNDFALSPNQKGLPEGHSQLFRFMSIPVLVDGKVHLLFGVGNKAADYTARDVTQLQLVANELHKILDQRAVQVALRASEQRFRDISDAAGEFIWETDASYAAIHVSDRAETILGYGIEELLGRRATEFVEEGMRQYVHTVLRRVGDENAPFRNVEIPLKHKSGHRVWLRIAGVPVRDSNGSIVGMRGAALDITQQKTDEEERERLQEQLAHAQRMESVGRLAGGVAHDFNNILSVINGYSELVLDELPEGSPWRQELQDIRKAGDRAAGLTRQLLAFSRKQVLMPRALSLNRVLEDLQSMLRRLLGEDIELAIVLDPGLRTVKADPGQMEQVVVNLAVNARDAMPNGGKLTLATTNVPAGSADPDLSYPRIPSSPHVMLSVADTGAGMSQDTLQHIFEPFFTTKERGRGTGLGLATVYGIVHQSGGEISVKSQPGQGTEFKIYLPATAEIPESERAENALAPEQGAETILVVEDEEAVRFLTQRILSAAGYTVLTAANGVEALELLSNFPEIVHLLLTDVIMPGMNGKELADRVRRARADVKILFMSGYTDDAIVHHGVLAEGVNFINKPFETLTLRRKVREALADS